MFVKFKVLTLKLIIQFRFFKIHSHWTNKI